MGQTHILAWEHVHRLECHAKTYEGLPCIWLSMYGQELDWITSVLRWLHPTKGKQHLTPRIAYCMQCGKKDTIKVGFHKGRIKAAKQYGVELTQSRKFSEVTHI